ncbi:MAG: DUF1761 domain-containing protein [Parachlamydia sp.]|nr:DUF1761 domain-containing protein [Parachlamydia sp.]
MSISDVNLLAVLVSGLLSIVIGGLWYSPKLFGSKWLELSNVNPEECKGRMGKCYLGAFILGLIMSFVLALFVKAAHAQTALDGAKVGFWAWLGFGATIPFSAVLWEKKPVALYLIHTGCLLVTLLVIGALLAVW